MASINLKGYLREPLGETSGGNKIVFTHVSTTGEVIAGSRTSYTVEANGYYDIDIEYGNVAIETSDLNSRSWQYHGTTTINQDTTATTLPTLLNSFVPPTDDQIILFQDLVKDAEDARDASAASAAQSEAAAQSSINNSILMNEQQARAKNATNNNHFDASGMVHMGKHYSNGTIYNNVNEGMFTGLTTSWANKILTGEINAPQGTSKTIHAVTHIAGAVSNLVAKDTGNSFAFDLPEAEDGTRIYNSTGDARGSGKASLDLKVDVDPKYGDVPTGTEAQILREGVGRAFEGECKNGDFRNGLTNWLAETNTSAVLNPDGSVTITPTTSNNRYFYQQVALTGAVDIEVTFRTNYTGFVTVPHESGATTFACVANELTTYKYSPANRTATIFPVSTDGTGAPTDSITVYSMSIRKATEEVVTHPVDLVGLEYYEEELTGTQEVFECIQSLSTTFGDTDVPTVLSTRKLSYFQQYDGQFPEVTADPDFINDRYRCVVWADLTDEQKRKVAAYMGEKLFVGVNGNIVNGRLRARTFRGGKNGDWDFYKSALSSTANYLYVTPEYRPQVQGISDTVDRYVGNVGALTYGNGQVSGLPATVYNENSLFTARSAESRAYQGRCFMYVVATVPRANKGIYVKGLNEYGTAKCSDDKFWYESANKPTTFAECFIGQVGGDIASVKSGHPDGIFYDGIEAGGLNGVIDWRLGAVANDSPEEAAKVEAKVENKTYRGLEKLVRTSFLDGINSPTSTPSLQHGVGWSEAHNLKVGDTLALLQFDNVTYLPVVVVGITNSTVVQVQHIDRTTLITRGVTEKQTLTTREINLSVSGEFNTKMVTGDPANFLLTDALKDGWLGTWGGVSGSQVQLTRKHIGAASIPITYTADNGGTWNQGTSNVVPATNVVSTSQPIALWNYKAFAKQTKKSNNKPVYNAKAGLLGVTVTQSYDKSVLAEAVAGVILKSDASGITTEQSSPVKFLVNEVTERITSLATDMVAPTNSSQAIKIAVYQISENGQVSLGFIANTMTHNGADWGELDEIIIPFGNLEVDTFNDANGILQTAQSTISAIPHGWTSNHARAGVQVPGVDL